MDENFGQVSDVIQTALDKTNKALSIVTAAEQDLDKVSQIAGNGIELAEGLNQFVDSSEEAFQTIGPTIRQNLLLVQQITNAAGDVFAQLQNSDHNNLPTVEDLDRIASRLGVAVKLVDSMAELLGNINNLLPSQPLADKITQLNSISDKLQLQIRLAGIISDAMRRNTTPPTDVIAQLNTLSKDISSGIGNILNTYESEISPALAAGADKLRSTLSTSAETLQGAKDRIPDIADILASAKEGITFGQAELTKIQSELPQIQSKIHEISETLANKSEGFIQALNTVSSLIRNDLPKLGNKLNEAADFVRNDLPNAEKQIGKASDFVQNQLPEVEKEYIVLPRWYVMICQHWKVPSVRLLTNFGKSKVITSLPSSPNFCVAISKKKVLSFRVPCKSKNNSFTRFRIMDRPCHHFMVCCPCGLAQHC